MPMPDDELLSPLIRREATRHAPPPALAERIEAQTRAAAAAATSAAAPVTASVPGPSVHPLARWLRAALTFGAGAATAWLLIGGVLFVRAPNPVGDEIAASHVRSLLAGHLTDVTSTDHHTVKPWFAGKLDYAPPVQDLADRGFPLAGGRLDVIGGRPVAALVYRDGAHIINLFVWPAARSADAAARSGAPSLRGYSVVDWRQQGMQFWAVSDASPAELGSFQGALRARLDAGTPP